MAVEFVDSHEVLDVPGYWGLLGSKKHPLVYMNMPKSGCTTIKNYLFYLDTGSVYKDPLAIHFNNRALLRIETQPLQLLAKLTRQDIVFTFIREPIGRIYSCYNEKIHSASQYSFPDVRAYLEENYGLQFPQDGKISLDNHIANFSRFITFLTRNLAGRTPVRKDYHWQAQHRVIKQQSANIVLDFIGIIETFERDFRQLLAAADVPTTISFDRKFNESSAVSYPMKDVVQSEVEARLRALYENDLEFYALRKSIDCFERRAVP